MSRQTKTRDEVITLVDVNTILLVQSESESAKVNLSAVERRRRDFDLKVNFSTLTKKAEVTVVACSTSELNVHLEQVKLSQVKTLKDVGSKCQCHGVQDHKKT